MVITESLYMMVVQYEGIVYVHMYVYSGTYPQWTPLGPSWLSCIERWP